MCFGRRYLYYLEMMSDALKQKKSHRK